MLLKEATNYFLALNLGYENSLRMELSVWNGALEWSTGVFKPTFYDHNIQVFQIIGVFKYTH